MHRVSIAVTPGDAGTAIAAARGINIDAITVTERKAALLIDTARALMQRGRHEGAYHALRKAHHGAPEEVAGRAAGRALARDRPGVAPARGRRVRSQHRRHRVTSPDRVSFLTVVVCGAGPAATVTALTGQAAGAGWTVQVVATPAALAFIDAAAIEEQTGSPVRSQYSPPGSPRSKVPDVIIVAPGTYNTICKWASGTSDTYALGILAEMTGTGIPVIVLPYVNAALAGRAPFHRAVESLRDEGARILPGPGLIEPHQPRSGPGPGNFPWHLALGEAGRLLRP
ncbi:MAG: flavoprotein [Trebonia sp.]